MLLFDQFNTLFINRDDNRSKASLVLFVHKQWRCNCNDIRCTRSQFTPMIHVDRGSPPRTGFCSNLHCRMNANVCLRSRTIQAIVAPMQSTVAMVNIILP